MSASGADGADGVDDGGVVVGAGGVWAGGVAGGVLTYLPDVGSNGGGAPGAVVPGCGGLYPVAGGGVRVAPPGDHVLVSPGRTGGADDPPVDDGAGGRFPGGGSPRGLGELGALGALGAVLPGGVAVRETRPRISVP